MKFGDLADKKEEFMKVMGKNIPGSGNSLCKSLKGRISLVCSWNRAKASVTEYLAHPVDSSFIPCLFPTQGVESYISAFPICPVARVGHELTSKQ